MNFDQRLLELSYYTSKSYVSGDLFFRIFPYENVPEEVNQQHLEQQYKEIQKLREETKKLIDTPFVFDPKKKIEKKQIILEKLKTDFNKNPETEKKLKELESEIKKDIDAERLRQEIEQKQIESFWRKETYLNHYNFIRETFLNPINDYFNLNRDEMIKKYRTMIDDFTGNNDYEKLENFIVDRRNTIFRMDGENF